MDADPGPKSWFSRATKEALDRGCARSTHGAVAVLESDWGTMTGHRGQADGRRPIVYNDHFTLGGVPKETYRNMLGSRSAIQRIMERYQVKVDKASGIRNDLNDWPREVDSPRCILDLFARIVTVSLETMAIVDALPAP